MSETIGCMLEQGIVALSLLAAFAFFCFVIFIIVRDIRYKISLMMWKKRREQKVSPHKKKLRKQFKRELRKESAKRLGTGILVGVGVLGGLVLAAYILGYVMYLFGIGICN